MNYSFLPKTIPCLSIESPDSRAHSNEASYLKALYLKSYFVYGFADEILFPTHA
jgi:hypothetical protein